MLSVLGWATGHSTVFITPKINLYYFEDVSSRNGMNITISTSIESQRNNSTAEYKFVADIPDSTANSEVETMHSNTVRYSNQYKNIDKYKQSVEFAQMHMLMQNYIKILVVICFLSILYVIVIYRKRLFNLFGESTTELKRYR